MEKSLFKKWLVDLRVGWEESQPGTKIQPVLRLGLKNKEDRTQKPHGDFGQISHTFER